MQSRQANLGVHVGRVVAKQCKQVLGDEALHTDRRADELGRTSTWEGDRALDKGVR